MNRASANVSVAANHDRTGPDAIAIACTSKSNPCSPLEWSFDIWGTVLNECPLFGAPELPSPTLLTPPNLLPDFSRNICFEPQDVVFPRDNAFDFLIPEDYGSLWNSYLFPLVFPPPPRSWKE